MKAKITKSTVDRLQPGTTLWDTEVTGFGVRYQKAHKTYYLKTRAQGKDHWLPIGRHGAPFTAETARDRARVLLGKIVEGTPVAELRKSKVAVSTVSELADKYLLDHSKDHKKPKTYTSDQSNIINHIRPKLGQLAINEVTMEKVQKFLNDIGNGKVAPKQADSKQGNKGGAKVSGGPIVANRVRALLSHMFAMAEKWELLPQNANPVKNTNKFKEKAKERFLSDTERDELHARLAREESTHPYHVAAYRLLILTGARLNEILTLKWTDVDIDRRVLNLPDSKTGKKAILLTEAAMEILTSIKKVKSNPYVIVGGKSGKHLVNLRKHWSSVRKDLGLGDVRLHDLRHTYASAALAQGVPLAFVGKLLGHKNSSTTQRYAHLANDPIRQAAELIAATQKSKSSVQKKAASLNEA